MCGKIFFFCSSVAFSISFISGDVLSMEYPTREIEFIVGFPPGSSVDHAGRLVAKFAEKYAGKPIVAANKPGGGEPEGSLLLLQPNPMDTQSGLCPSRRFSNPIL